MLPYLIALVVLLAVAVGFLLWRARRVQAVARRCQQRLRSELAAHEAALRHARSVHERAEHELKVSDQLFEALFDSAWDMIFICGITADGLLGQFRRVNDVACERLEQTRARLLEMAPRDIEEAQGSSYVRLYNRTELVILSDDDIRYRETTSERQLVSEILNAAEAHYERVFVTRTGKKVPVEVRARPFQLLGETLILATARDVSQRKKQERALREGQERLHDLLVHSPIGLAVYDASRQLIDVNKACLRMFGTPVDEAFARCDLFRNPFIPPPVRQCIDRGETVRYEAVFDFDEVKRSAMFVSQRKGTAHFDVLMINLGFDHEFKPKGFLVQIQDTTQRRRAEASLRQLEQQLNQSQKMQAIGSLASGIAHDFNNILTPIIGYTEMLLEDGMRSATGDTYMREVLKASHRAKDLVNQILTFSRQTEPAGMPLHAGSIIKEVLRFIESTLPPGVEARREYHAEHDSVLGDPTQIHQVMMNLCTNAAYAMRETGGILEVRTSNLAIKDRSGSAEFPYLPPGNYLRLSVKDTGTGMDDKTAERIFEPFFTTKPHGEGTGMGLAVVHGIVTGMKGGIRVDTEKGRGSTFTVMLPLVEEEEEHAPEEPRTLELPRGLERILVVDDEQDVLNMAQHMLTSLGYKVTGFRSPVEALRRFRRAPDDFDLVMTDQVMPDLSGDELAKELLAIRADVPIILCTGFSGAVTPKRAVSLGIREFVMKPVVMRNLAGAIRRALDDGTGLPAGRLPGARAVSSEQ